MNSESIESLQRENSELKRKNSELQNLLEAVLEQNKRNQEVIDNNTKALNMISKVLQKSRPESESVNEKFDTNVLTGKIPPYLNNLSENGLLDLKTMRVQASNLNSFAVELLEELTKTNPNRKLTKRDLEMFKKSNGERYADVTIKKAVNLANTD